MTRNLKRIIVVLSIIAVCLLGILGYQYYKENSFGFHTIDDGQHVIFIQKNKERMKGKQNIDGHTYFFDQETGYMLTGLFDYEKKTYYCDEEGIMQVGPKKIKDKEYYFGKDGAMVKGDFVDVKDDKVTKTYYYDQAGLKTTGLEKIKDAYYYFDKDGVLLKKQAKEITLKNEKQPIVADEKGRLKLGLQKYKDDYYYFNEDVSVLRNQFKVVTMKDQSQESYFDASGKMLKGMQTIEGYDYYFNGDGAMAIGLEKIKDHFYYFFENGVMAKNQYLNVEVYGLIQNVYFDAKGQMDEKNVRNPEKEPPVTEVAADMKELQAGIQKIMNKYGGATGLYFKDLKSGKRLIMNDQNMYPCCMIKTPALVTIYQEAEKGRINTADYAWYIEKMITISDNTSYNTMMQAIGGGNGIKGVQKVNQFCQSIGMNHTALHHGLRPGSGYFTDGGSNTARPSDLGLLFEQIYNGSLVSAQSNQEIMNLLLRCDDPDEIQAGLPAGTPFAHKTGCAYALYHDGGIVFAPNRDYVLVIFSDGSSSYTSMMAEISAYIYNYVVSLG